MNLIDAIKKSRAYLCLECGKCTGSCPVSRFNRGFSPRAILNKSIRSKNIDLLKDKNIWSCLTCKLCDERCPAEIDYINLTLAIRSEAQKSGEEALCSHGGTAQSIMRIMTSADLVTRRMDGIDKNLRTTDSGEILFFVGCSPYFDVLFSDIGVSSVRAANATIKLLNHLNIDPVVLAQERCCGHDLLWAGDFQNFKKLAEFNINLFKKSGVKKIVFSCPECYRTLKIDYAKFFNFNVEMMHISEFLARELDEKKLNLKEMERIVTFQDPCRLGRHLGIYEEPRKILNTIPKLRVNEMPRSKKQAVCCGVSAWMNCSTYSKQIQLMRLKEAKETGADLLVLACPKCEIHFNCAMKEASSVPRSEESRIETTSLINLIADLLGE